jgi:hypothetical protein
VFDGLQHLSLVVCVLDLLHLHHLRLLEHLDGIEALVVLRLHQVHPPEATGAQRPLYGEVREGVLALGRPWLGGHSTDAAIGVLLIAVQQVLYARRVRARDAVRLRGELRGRHGLVGRLCCWREGVLRASGRVLLRSLGASRGRGRGRGRRRLRRAGNGAVGGGTFRLGWFGGRGRAVLVFGGLVLRPLLLQEAAEGWHIGVLSLNSRPLLEFFALAGLLPAKRQLLRNRCVDRGSYRCAGCESCRKPRRHRALAGDEVAGRAALRTSVCARRRRGTTM